MEEVNDVFKSFEKDLIKMREVSEVNNVGRMGYELGILTVKLAEKINLLHRTVTSYVSLLEESESIKKKQSKSNGRES